MITIDPKKTPPNVFHKYLLGSVVPRPIAFVSSVDKNERVNLSPFSFFNVFGSNPPTLVFSPSKRVRDNSDKHTLENVMEVPEVVINMVNFELVEQMSLASTEYGKDENEFDKAGLTQVPSIFIKPPRVAESPVAFECKVLDVIQIGKDGGSANLVICEVLLIHIKTEILDENDFIDPFKLDAIARMSGNWYCRANGAALFEIPKPLSGLGIGVDSFPSHVRNSTVLNGNNLGRLGGVLQFPTPEEIGSFAQSTAIQEIFLRFKNDEESLVIHLHGYAKELIEAGEVENAWKALLQLK